MMLVTAGSTLFVMVGLAVMDFTIFAGDDGGYSKAGSPEKKLSIQYNKVKCRNCIIN
jgi:hypothetical protein